MLIRNPAGEAFTIQNIPDSVAGPWHFDTDQDPRIRTSDYRILLRLQIRFFRDLQDGKKNIFFCLLVSEATFR